MIFITFLPTHLLFSRTLFTECLATGKRQVGQRRLQVAEGSRAHERVRDWSATAARQVGHRAKHAGAAQQELKRDSVRKSGTRSF